MEGLQRALEGAAGAIAANLAQFQSNMRLGLQQAGAAVAEMQRHVGRQLEGPSGPAPLLAVSGWSGRRGLQRQHQQQYCTHPAKGGPGPNVFHPRSPRAVGDGAAGGGSAGGPGRGPAAPGAAGG